MISVKVFVIACTMVLMFGRANAVAGDLADVCKTDGTCTDPTNHMCDPSDFKCKVIADGAKTDCSSLDTNCVANAVCSTTTCACSTGYTQTGGLCTVIGDMCTADADCSAKITNSYCAIYKPCEKGRCTCSTGYSGTVCTTLSYDVACSASNDQCDAGLACTNSKCACSSDTWNSDVSACTAKKTFGQSCSAIADCYIVALGNGACTGGSCTCATDYVEDKTTGAWSCRKPYAGESSCTSGNCIAIPSVPVTSDTSQQDPTCTSSTCGCASGESQYESFLGLSSTCRKYCITDAASGATSKDNGATCTHHNECKNNLCLKCPGDAADVCYTATCDESDASMIHVNAVLMALLMAAAALKSAF